MSSYAQLKTTLEVAAKAAHTVLHPAKAAKKKPWYLSQDFSLVQKPPKSAEEANKIAQELLKQVQPLFTISRSPKKLEDAVTICHALVTQSPHLADQVKKTVAVLEQERLKELPASLSKLVQLKEVASLFSIYVRRAFPTIRFLNFVNETSRPGAVLKDEHGNVVGTHHIATDISDEARLALMESPDGLAFVTMRERDKDDVEATKEYFRALKNFSEQGSPSVRWFATRTLRSIDGSYEQFKFNQCAETIRDNVSGGPAFFCNPLNPYYDRGSGPFMQMNFPAFVPLISLYNKCESIDKIIKAYPSVKNFYKACQEAAIEMPKLDALYRSHYTDLLALSKKYDSDATPSLQATMPSLLEHAETGEISLYELPDPDTFASMNMLHLDGIDTAEFHPKMPPPPLGSENVKADGKEGEHSPPKEPETAAIAAPSQAKQKAKKRAQSEPAATASATATAAAVPEASPKQSVNYEAADNKSSVPARSQRVESKENKKHASSSPSIYAGQLKTIQYADRVEEWDRDPKAALTRPEYSNLPANAVDEVIWKHATSVVDPFLGTAYSRKVKWKNKHTGYIIEADVVWTKKLADGREQKKSFRGFFRYAFNEKGELYHRDFGEKTNYEILDAICRDKLFREEDFPTLEQSHQDFVKRGKPTRIAEVSENSCDPDAFGIITLQDKKYGLEIRIYRQGKLKELVLE